MKNLLSFLMISCFSFSTLGFGQESERWTKAIREKVKPAIVNVFTSLNVGLSYEFATSLGGTGSIVDKHQGIILTNKHVVGLSPHRRIEVSFSSGESTDAKVLYVHPWHDFAFIQIDPKKLAFTKLEQVTLGNFSSLEEGDEVLQIGNTESNPYSMSKLEVSNLFRNQNIEAPFYRHTHMVHLSGIIAGGASGSPIFNQQGQVVALLNSGVDTQTYALRIDYIKDALQILRTGKQPVHGDILVQFDTPEIKYILDYQPKTKALQAWIDQAIRSQTKIKNYTLIKSLIPGTEAYEKLKVGDIVLSIKKKKQDKKMIVTHHLYEIDKMVDQQVGKSIFLTVYRDQKVLEDVELPVSNAKEHMIREYATFGFATFHPVDANLALYLGIPEKGIFLSEAVEGKSFFDGLAAIRYRSDEYKKAFGKRTAVIEKIDRFSFHSMREFVSALEKCHQKGVKNTDVLLRDFQQFYPGLRENHITLDFVTDPFQQFSQDDAFQWTRIPSTFITSSTDPVQ
ncbi:MAG: S1C family serine protease [Bdellovibrionota bacterium]